MPTIEEELTQVLQHHAETVAPDPNLLTAVRARSRRSTLTHRTALIAAVAAAVAAVAILPSVADLGILGPRQSQQVAVTADGFLADGPALPYALPFTPTYLPPGLTDQPRSRGDEWAQGASWSSRPDSSSMPELSIETGHPELQPHPAGPDTSPISVNGQPGILITRSAKQAPPQGGATVRWLRNPSQYIEVSGQGKFGDKALLLRVAEGLVDKPLKTAWPFVVPRVPAGFNMRYSAASMFVVGPPLPNVAPEDPRWNAADNAKVFVEANRVAANANAYGAPVTVGNRSGWLKSNSARHLKPGDEALTLTLRVSATTVLEFRTTGAPWTADRLKAFAAGVTYNGPTPPVNVNN